MMPKLIAASISVMLAMLLVGATIASALPDNRGYEMVSPLDTNGTSPGSAVPAISGNAVDFGSEPFGEATIGTQMLYQGQRTPNGWKVRPLTPSNVVQNVLLAETAQLFISPELTQTIFLTEQPFAAGDKDHGALDLYEESSDGTLNWVTQGTQGGTAPISATYDGANSDGSHVVFDSAESLLPDATGLEESGYRTSAYLYVRDVPTGQTNLVDVNNQGTLLNPEGAILGNGDYLEGGEPPSYDYLASDYMGTITHAISSDGSKIFFESPTPSLYETNLKAPSLNHVVHLYMRKDSSVTVALDNEAAASGAGARYLGASEDGTYVFFVSDEGLAGDEFHDTELYVYNTDTEKLTPISVAPAGETPVDGSVYGVSAISNDGSHVYYVAKGRLATNTNGAGETAIEGQPNFYAYDVNTGKNTFIAQLGDAEVEPSEGAVGLLVSFLDIERPVVPTPDGEVLVFMSELDLTGEDPQETPQVYRYDAKSDSLICVSCSPTGTGGSSLGDLGPGGASGGGSYDPPGQAAPMSANGDRIFFETENGLVPEDHNSNAPPGVFKLGESKIEIPNSLDVYEWENGKIYLISAGQPGLTTFQSTTPSGDDVFFNTDISLTGGPTSGYMSLYDARVDGGFSTEGGALLPSCASSESCRSQTGGAPTSPVPGSTTLQGPEVNPLASPPAPQTLAKPHKKSAGRKGATSKRKQAKGKQAKGKKSGHKQGTAHKRARKARHQAPTGRRVGR